MSDEEDPRPYDPEELDDEIEEIDDDGPDGEPDDELAEALPRSIPPESRANLDDEPERHDPEQPAP